MRQHNSRSISQRVVYLGHGIRISHEIQDLFPSRLGIDCCSIADIARPFALIAKFAAYLYFDASYLNPTLVRFAVDVIAVASRKGEKEQFAAINARTATVRLSRDVQRVLMLAALKIDHVSVVLIGYAC